MHSVSDLIKLALEEDIGSGDITTDYAVPEETKGLGIIVAKEPLVLAGLEIAKQVFTHLDSTLFFESVFKDGDRLEKGETALTVEGNMRVLLKGERTALNFMQHLSGIATLVRSYVEIIKNKPVRLVDTRKTTPGLRVLEKYAVRTGGGYNHRTGLYDGVLIKDNHIAACGGITPAVEKIRKQISHLVKIEVEVTSLDEVREALKAGAEVIMLDNMNLDQVREAVSVIQGRALVEVSGNVTEKTLSGLADTGVDIISSGALTHSARSVDLSMRIKALI
ncbi:MAG: carboxylating nicotinate-nucleotide diphosphorylase [Proteobacteria bacterium]|nr:carboxylating nicotinate-nucleotide diphosphorylase [Pseudomonadota bacterium]MBU4469446.1 carboxylating nicotinate-nucleotide diphosphorylase [Pseudomonadota bacterium]MCG2752347.1 carboxylating nicotinate-nucleotide diphosphorylase [Desulfobacteraceae bacterium]